MSATQPDILLLADAYADASFDQGLNQRTEDPAPELARGALSAGVGVLYAQRDELLAALKEADEDFALEGFDPDGAYRKHIRDAIAKATGGKA